MALRSFAAWRGVAKDKSRIAVRHALVVFGVVDIDIEA